jgi:hypothetical protein
MPASDSGAETLNTAVRRLSLEFLAGAPEGLRYSELLERLRQALPGRSVPGPLVRCLADLPSEIDNPSRGYYRHVSFATAAPAKPAAGGAKRIAESDFYQPFADYLVNELEECTRAVPLGGKVFRDKWGTPDVLGVRQARHSDIVKFATEIIAAEIKTDGTQLITAFGQTCAYRLFSHRAYLVVPAASPEEDVQRLDVLARIFGIGLILFDATSVATPRWSIRVRASRHEPDGFYVNRCLKFVEKELFE